MKSLKRYLILLIIIFAIILLGTKSKATLVKEYDFNRETLKANNISGICKIYIDREARYYKKNLTGVYAENVKQEEVETLRASIKQTINSLKSGEYLMSKILKSDTYYDAENKEFCYKRDAASVSTDTLTKVIVVGYNDNYEFKSNLSSSKGAYIVKKVGETEEFYVSYEDSWVEAELSEMCDANSIELDKSSIEVKVGETVEVKYNVLPENAISKSVSVSYTDNIEIDTTTAGTVKIKGLTKGDAYIIVKLKSNKEITAKCDIKVVSDTSEPTPTPSDENISSNKYLINVEQKYISRVKPKVSINDFKSNIICNVEYRINDKNGTVVSDADTLVSTGMKLKTEKQEYTIVVKGDINGDGQISITDVVKSNLYSVHIQTPNEIEKIAADINEDGKITITDVVQLKLASVNIKPIE